MTVPQADSTLVAIRKKVRRLTASASQSSLTNNDLDQYINTFYNNDFPYGIKIDQMRSVYTFFTAPYIDRYPLDVNYNQGVRAPMYVDGIQGQFYKDRQQFFNVWPKFPTLAQPATGDGMTKIFSWTLPAPFLSGEVTIGTIDVNGNVVQVSDDGNGNLLLQVPNPVSTVPIYNSNGIAPIPGMHNQNTGNPGLNYQGTETSPNTNAIGTVNYVTGAFSIIFPVAPGNAQIVRTFTSQYQPGLPYNLLFWNNTLTIRPVPKFVHRVTIETFLTPVQFMSTTDVPILNQWWQLIAIGAAIKVLEDRQDMEGVQNLIVLYDRQEDLVLERQGVEEIFQPNITLFNSTTQSFGYGAPWGSGAW